MRLSRCIFCRLFLYYVYVCKVLVLKHVVRFFTLRINHLVSSFRTADLFPLCLVFIWIFSIVNWIITRTFEFGIVRIFIILFRDRYSLVFLVRRNCLKRAKFSAAGWVTSLLKYRLVTKGYTIRAVWSIVVVNILIQDLIAFVLYHLIHITDDLLLI